MDDENGRPRRGRDLREYLIFNRVVNRIETATEQNLHEVAEAAQVIIAEGPGAEGLASAIELRLAIELERCRRLLAQQDGAPEAGLARSLLETGGFRTRLHPQVRKALSSNSDAIARRAARVRRE